MTTSSAPTQIQDVTDRRSASAEGSSRQQLLGLAWFVSLSLALAGATVAVSAPPALVPFVLAVGPLLIALALAWYEGYGALHRLARSLTIGPIDRRWYLVLALPARIRSCSPGSSSGPAAVS
jgi:hypothetical protein